jgi:phospholipase/carboxylesterase
MPTRVTSVLASFTIFLLACGPGSPSDPAEVALRPGDEKASRSAEEGRLSARPSTQGARDFRPGLHELGLTRERDALLYVPEAYSPRRKSPLVLMLHGAGSCAERALRPFIPHAEKQNLILLAPPSRGSTWDVIMGGFGPDVEFIDEALALVFERYNIDEERLAVEGFSDGATYALSLGLTNGDLFSHVIAFSPEFLAPGDIIRKPPIFVSHGTRDGVLPIEATSRRIVPRLESAGYEVEYVEFEGRHIAAPLMARRALAWFLGRTIQPGDPTETTGDEPC